MTPAEFKQARKLLGFTQKRMGVHLGKTGRMIAYYEAGYKIPVLVSDKVREMVREKDDE